MWKISHGGEGGGFYSVEGTWKGQSKKRGPGESRQGQGLPLSSARTTPNRGRTPLPSIPKGKEKGGDLWGGGGGGSMSTPELMLVVDFRKLPSRRLNLISFKRSKS